VLRRVSWRGGAAAGSPRPGAGVADTDSAAGTGDTACERTGSCTRTRTGDRTGCEAGPGDGAIRGR
jgi:hypothetical protein